MKAVTDQASCEAHRGYTPGPNYAQISPQMPKYHQPTIKVSLRRLLEPPPRAVRFDALIDVSPPLCYQCSWVLEHVSWQRFGERWPTGLPVLRTVDDLSADATDDADDDEDDVPVLSDEEEGFGDTSVDDGSAGAADDDDDDDDEVPMVSEKDDVEECWADDF